MVIVPSVSEELTHRGLLAGGLAPALGRPLAIGPHLEWAWGIALAFLGLYLLFALLQFAPQFMHPLMHAVQLRARRHTEIGSDPLDFLLHLRPHPHLRIHYSTIGFAKLGR